MVNAGNAGVVHGRPGSVGSVREKMEAFDRLPPELRAALREAVVNWCPGDLWLRWQACAVRYGEERATRRALRAIAAGEAEVMSDAAREAEALASGSGVAPKCRSAAQSIGA